LTFFSRQVQVMWMRNSPTVCFRSKPDWRPIYSTEFFRASVSAVDVPQLRLAAAASSGREEQRLIDRLCREQAFCAHGDGRRIREAHPRADRKALAGSGGSSSHAQAGVGATSSLPERARSGFGLKRNPAVMPRDLSRVQLPRPAFRCQFFPRCRSFFPVSVSPRVSLWGWIRFRVLRSRV